jgi:hypothetical protein
VAYLRVALSGVAAIFVALLVPLFLLMAPMGVARTVGFGAIARSWEASCRLGAGSSQLYLSLCSLWLVGSEAKC